MEYAHAGDPQHHRNNPHKQRGHDTIFIDRGTKLVTIGSRQHNSVLVYSMNDYQLACASHLPHGRLVGLSGG